MRVTRRQTAHPFGCPAAPLSALTRADALPAGPTPAAPPAQGNARASAAIVGGSGGAR